VVKLKADEIIERLESFGMVHRSVACTTEGDYLPTDVDWNNKDVPHLNEVHSLVNDITCVVERDLEASISLQKVAGITNPLILVHYDTAPRRQTHFVTLWAWTLVTHHEFEQIGPNRTRATTTYTVCSSRFWMLFFPVIRAVIRRNWRQLMSEDVPLRERRGRLRSWGYTFRGDDEPMRDIRASLPIQANNVLLPDPPLPRPELAPVPLSDITEDAWVYLGRDDHLGLKVRREGNRLLAHLRSCPHEGALLDAVEPEGGCQVCPWHARELPPVAVLDLDGEDADARTDWHRLRVADGHLVVEVTATGTPGEPTISGRRHRAAPPPAR